MAYIAASQITFPAHYYPQKELATAFSTAVGTDAIEPSRVNLLFQSTRVKGRYFAAPIPEIEHLHNFGTANDLYIKYALQLGTRCLQDLFAQTEIEPKAISQLTFASSTGLAIPSIEARLVNQLSFSPYVKRTPLVGLGCMAGAAGIARVADYLQGHADEAAIFLTAELCSLTFQYTDTSMANVVACGLFGDGVGAVLMLGRHHPMVQSGMPQVMATRSILVPNSERVLGFDVVETGLKIVLDLNLSSLAESTLPTEIEAFLAQNELSVANIGVWLVHPGGPKIIEAVGKGLGLKSSQLALSYETLEQVGNISSVSVLHMLDKVISQPEPGSYGLIVGLGPGFSAELILLKW